jgi:hypothetical protein
MIDWPKAMEAQWGDVVKLATTRGQLREEWISTNRPYPAPRSDSLPRFSLIGAAGTIAARPFLCALKVGNTSGAVPHAMPSISVKSWHRTALESV